jgi:hypothetical protein
VAIRIERNARGTFLVIEFRKAVAVARRRRRR